MQERTFLRRWYCVLSRLNVLNLHEQPPLVYA